MSILEPQPDPDKGTCWWCDEPVDLDVARFTMFKGQIITLHNKEQSDCIRRFTREFPDPLLED